MTGAKGTRDRCPLKVTRLQRPRPGRENGCIRRTEERPGLGAESVTYIPPHVTAPRPGRTARGRGTNVCFAPARKDRSVQIARSGRGTRMSAELGTGGGAFFFPNLAQRSRKRLRSLKNEGTHNCGSRGGAKMDSWTHADREFSIRLCYL